MKIICSIETLCELIAKGMPKRGKAIGITLFTLDLYQGAKLSRGTMERLQQHKETLAEITLPLKEWETYHQEFTQCEESRRLTIEDYIAVAMAKSNGYMLLTDSGCLGRYAESNGVEAMSLDELDRYCERRQRQVRNRKESLQSHFSRQENKCLPEEEPNQQPIDDDTTF